VTQTRIFLNSAILIGPSSSTLTQYGSQSLLNWTSLLTRETERKKPALAFGMYKRRGLPSSPAPSFLFRSLLPLQISLTRYRFSPVKIIYYPIHIQLKVKPIHGLLSVKAEKKETL
jgi:hypothetical protein